MARSNACDGPSCEFQHNLELLRQNHFFAALPLEPLKVLAYISARTTYKPGDLLFQKDDADGQAFYILSGTAGLVPGQGMGEAVSTYGEGEFLGALALLSEMHRLFSLRAETELTCLVLTREKFSKVVAQFPDIMPRFLDALVEAISHWEKRVFLDPQERCESCYPKMGVTLI